MDPSRVTAPQPVEVATLLGARGLDSSIRCLQSLQQNSVSPLRFRVHDDGTLSRNDLARLRSDLDLSRIVLRPDADLEAARRLAGYPASRKLRNENVLALKLFDVAWFEESEHLRYVDSDVLFLKPFSGPPATASLAQSVFFPDSQSAYSVRFWELVGPRAVKLPGRLNTGLFTILKSAIDIERIERFLASWRGFAPVWIEQTCWALAAGTEGSAILDGAQFRIHDPRIPVGPEVIGLHFVSSVRSDLARIAAQQARNPKAPAIDARANATRPLSPGKVLVEALRRRLGR